MKIMLKCLQLKNTLTQLIKSTSLSDYFLNIFCYLLNLIYYYYNICIYNVLDLNINAFSEHKNNCFITGYFPVYMYMTY